MLRLVRLLLLGWCCAWSGWAAAAGNPSLALDELPAGALGRQTQWLLEPEGPPLDLAQARQLLADGAFRQGERSVPAFGIGSRPVWMVLSVRNRAVQPAERQLLIGTTWLDRVDVYLVHGAEPPVVRLIGDAVPGAEGVVPAVGLVVPLSLPSGVSEIYVRVETADPLLMPVELLTTQALQARERWTQYGYGFLYGVLAALLLYNAMIYVGLRERSYLYYAGYLLAFVGLNMGYTGHGWAWWWPESPGLQMFLTLHAMVVFSCLGLLFATRFLDLAAHAPRLRRGIGWACLATLAGMAAANLAGAHREAALLAFSFMLAYAVGMVVLGAWAVRSGWPAGRYFLAASVYGMLGAAVTVLSVWGIWPLTHVTLHAIEAGILLEAGFFAVALASRIHYGERARWRAERQARQDPLTGLPNRRGLLELARAPWSAALSGKAPLSVLMADIDHFKRINDRHGHETGDRVLAAVAQCLAEHCREGDVVARWGGEEFVLVLPGADLAQAARSAERMRRAVETLRWEIGEERMPLSISVGVAQNRQHERLDELLAEADACLYRAKHSGRNRVVRADEPVVELLQT